MQKRIAGRYAAERRFKAMGLGAVLLSGFFLAFLLFVMVGNGARGFTYTHVAVPIDFKAMPLTVDKARLSDADADQVIANAGLADIVAFAGGTPVTIEASAAQHYKITPEQLDAAITAKTRWIIFNSPSNPSGAAYSPEELDALGEVIRRHPHVMVMTDDMYEHVWYADFAFSTLAQRCPDLIDRILTVNGCSKAYAMTGWRIGYAGGPAWLIKAMGKLQSQSTSNPCSVAQAAAVAALGGPQQFLEERNAAFRKRRDMVVAMLNDAPGLNCPVPDGAFYVYPDASGCMGKTTPDGKPIDSDEALIDYFLDTARAAAVHGAAFGLSPAFRVSYATSEAVLKEACIRIQQACAALR